MHPLFNIPKGYETRMLVIRSISTLMEKESIDQISIKEICGKAGIAHQTFYNYFPDKYSAVAWYDTLMKQASLSEIGRSLTWFEGNLKMCQFVEAEPTFFRSALNSRKDPNSLLPFVIRYTYQEWKRTIGEHLGIVVNDNIDFQLRLWSKIAAETTTDWVYGGLRISAEQHVKHQDTCIPRNIYHIMNDPVLANRLSGRCSGELVGQTHKSLASQ